jgi:uncharacterized protein YjbJ (UPF0337 family)
MNKDQATGTAKRFAGKVQEEAGKIAGNRQQQQKGLKRQLDGKIQETVGDIENVAQNVKPKK